MLKVTVLIPVNFNNGMPIPQYVVDTALSTLTYIAGGLTDEGLVLGRYVMDDGTLATDRCHKVFVVIDADKLTVLRTWAANLCRACQQESIYFEVQEVQVEFVRAS